LWRINAHVKKIYGDLALIRKTRKSDIIGQVTIYVYRQPAQQRLPQLKRSSWATAFHQCDFWPCGLAQLVSEECYVNTVSFLMRFRIHVRSKIQVPYMTSLSSNVKQPNNDNDYKIGEGGTNAFVPQSREHAG